MIETLKQQLADQMEALAADLVGTPPTSRGWDELRFGRKGSLAVRIGGPKRGSFCDFSCDAKGDAISFIRHVRKCDTREAILWAKRWLGMTPGSYAPPLPPKPHAPTATPPESATIDLARRLWSEAMPARGTLAEKYLASRGLALEDAAPIRFHPRVWRKSANGPPGPAMISLMTSPEAGEPRGVHVTYLAPDGAGKAGGPVPKVMMGPAGVIRLSRDDQIGNGLGLAEGIETALSVMQRFGWRPVWCATSAGAIARFPVLAGIQTLTIFADQDQAGISAAQACAANWIKAGRGARVCFPAAGDFNDFVRGQTA